MKWDGSGNFDCKDKVWLKEISLFHKLWLYNPNIFATQCHRPEIFQTKNYVELNNQSLKYKRFTPFGCKDIGIR